MTTPLLTRAANGYNWLIFEAHDTPQWRMALAWLKDAGFSASGEPIVGLDEAILPSYTRHAATIAAGFDIWSGHYLLAECAAGDLVMLELAAHVGAEDRRKVDLDDA